MLSLLVLRCENLEVSKRFFECLGLAFECEKHGVGPLHYAAMAGGTVLELYPSTGLSTNDPIRLGFAVESESGTVARLQAMGLTATECQCGYVVKDHDGRKVEFKTR